MNDLNALLHDFLRRYRAALLARAGVLAALGLSIAVALAWRLTAGRLGPLISWGLPGALGLAAAASLLVWLQHRWPSPRAAAGELDRQLGLHERLVTAEEFARAASPPALYPALVEETAQRCAEARAKLPRPFDRTSGLLVALLLLLLLPNLGGRPWRIAAPPRNETKDSNQQSPPKAGPPSAEATRNQPQPQHGQQGQQGSAPQKPQEQAGQQGGDQQSPPKAGPPSAEAANNQQGQGNGEDEPQDQNRQGQQGGSQQAQSDNAPRAADGQQSATSNQQPAISNQQERQSGEQGQQSGGHQQSPPKAGPPSAEAPSAQRQQQDRGQGQQNGGQQGRASQQPGAQGQDGQGAAGQRMTQDAMRAQASSGQGGGQSPGDQAALKAEIQQLLKEVSGELKQLQQQLEQSGQQPQAGTGTDPSLYGQPDLPQPPGGTTSLPMALKTDTAPSTKKRPGGGLGKASGDLAHAAPSLQSEAAELSEDPLEETPMAREAVPPEYRDVVDRVRQQHDQPSEQSP